VGFSFILVFLFTRMGWRQELYGNRVAGRARQGRWVRLYRSRAMSD
jgi:hypothetical protein